MEIVLIATSLEPKLTRREGEAKPCSCPRSPAPHASALCLLTVTPAGPRPLTTTLWVACTCYAVNILKHRSDFFPCVCVCVWNFSPFCSVFKVVAGTPLLTTPNSFLSKPLSGSCRAQRIVPGAVSWQFLMEGIRLRWTRC